MIDLDCSWCNQPFSMLEKEFRRQHKKGRQHFFCSLSCAAQYGNSTRADRKIQITKVCPTCKKDFQSHTGAKAPSFCSRSCASAGSLTKHRLSKAYETGKRIGAKNFTLQAIAKSLRNRENWKYKGIIKYLTSIHEAHATEYPLEGYIFDLVLPTRKLLVEFDGPYHNYDEQLVADSQKTDVAIKAGWYVERIQVLQNSIIDPAVLFPLFTKYQEVMA